MSGHARQSDLASQKAGDLAADGKAQTRTSVLPARASVRLLKGLEDDLLLVSRNPDSGVRHRDRHDRVGPVQRLEVRIPASGSGLDPQRDAPAVGELERVGKQVLDDLLEALGVGDDRPRRLVSGLDLELELLGLGHVPERAIDIVEQVVQTQLADIHDDGSGLDLGEIQDVVDQGQEVLAGSVDRLGELGLFGAQVAVRVAGQLVGEDQEAVQGCAQLMRHVREELGFVLGGQGELARFLFEGETGLLDLLVLPLDFNVSLVPAGSGARGRETATASRDLPFSCWTRSCGARCRSTR